ncbi:MAG: transposase, partial [Planctomycetia bacterium]|nr:transposase [Planctomycetia bacterium]
MLIDEPWLYQLYELDAQVFKRVIRDDHPLNLALERIPWEEFRQTIESHYSPNLGQPAFDPLRMFKLEYLRYHCNLSDRQVIQRAETDIGFRYFLQIGLQCRLPDPSSLTRFRGRLGAEAFQALFDKLVAVAREQGLVKDRWRLKDASHVIANIPVPTTLKLVAQARDRLLDAATPFDTEAAEGQRINIELLRERARTEAYAAARRQHPAVERKLNEVMNHHGDRRARSWGLSKVHLQECMTCFTVNVKRL